MEKIDLPDYPQISLEFSQEDWEELERARKMPIVFDEDCPETTPEMASRFRRVNPPMPDRRRRIALENALKPESTPTN